MTQADREKDAAELDTIIRQARLSDTQIGAALGVSAMTIWNWRTGKYRVKKVAIEAIRRLCVERVNGATPKRKRKS